MKQYKCGHKSVCSRHPLKLVGFTDIAFKAQPYEPTNLALRGLSITLQENAPTNDQPHSIGGLANLVDFTIRRQKRVVRSTSSTELNGLIDNAKQLILLQIILHQIYCGTHQSPEEMIDLLEYGVYTRR